MINELTIKGLKCFEEAEFHFKKSDTACRKKFHGKVDRYSGIACNDTEGKESFSRRIYRYRKNQ